MTFRDNPLDSPLGMTLSKHWGKIETTATLDDAGLWIPTLQNSETGEVLFEDRDSPKTIRRDAVHAAQWYLDHFTQAMEEHIQTLQGPSTITTHDEAWSRLRTFWVGTGEEMVEGDGGDWVHRNDVSDLLDELLPPPGSISIDDDCNGKTDRGLYQMVCELNSWARYLYEFAGGVQIDPENQEKLGELINSSTDWITEHRPDKRRVTDEHAQHQFEMSHP